MCAFKITSETKSFKCVPALNGLPVYSLLDKGDVRSKKTGEVYDKYSVSLDVTDADWDDLLTQTEDAVDFLKTHKAALTELLNSSDDIDAWLDFPIWSRLSGDVILQSDFLPAELISLAGELKLRIGMSIYAVDAFDNVGAEQVAASDR